MSSGPPGGWLRVERRPALPAAAHRGGFRDPLRVPSKLRARTARVRGEARDQLRQCRIVHFVRNNRKRPRRIAPRVAILRGRCRERSDRQPRRDEESGDDPEETSSCRHSHTLSYLQPSANFCRDDINFPEAIYRRLTVWEVRPDPRRSCRRFAAAAGPASTRQLLAVCPACPLRRRRRGTRPCPLSAPAAPASP